MRYRKRLVSLLLAAALLVLPACSAENNGSQPPASSGGGNATTGRYAETDITPPVGDEGLFAVFQTGENSLEAYTDGLTKRFTSTDGGATWQEEAGPGAAAPELSNTEKLTRGGDGTLYATIADQAQGGTVNLVSIAPDGTVAPLSIPEFDDVVAGGNTPYVDTFRMVGDQLMISYSYGGMTFTAGRSNEDDDGGQIPAGDDDSVPADANPGTPDGNSTPDDSAPASTPPEGEGEEPDAEGANAMDASAYKNTAGLYNPATGEKTADLSDWSGLAAVAHNDNLYLMGYGGDIASYTLPAGTKDREIVPENADPDTISFNQTLAVGADGTLYTMDNRAIRRIGENGTPEPVVDAGAFTFGRSDAYIQSLFPFAADDFAVHMQGGDDAKLMRYTFDENATIDPAKTLNIWALKDNNTVRAAVSEFMKKHPDATVNLEFASEGNGAQSTDDALRNLNTRVLAGEGPDIIILDGCPVDSYANSGMLLDLAGLVDTSGMYDPLRAPFETENGTFMLPTRFALPLLMGTKGNLDANTTLDELLKTVTEGSGTPPAAQNPNDAFAALPENERPAFGFSDFGEMFDLLWNTSASEIITPQGLNSENLRTFLAAVQQISDKYGLAAEDTGMFGAAMVISSGTSGAFAIPSNAISYASQRANLAGFTVGDFLSPVAISQKDTAFAPFPGLASNAWLPSSLAGINANTKVQPLAVEFLQMMLGDEVQSANTGGLPVTKTGYAAHQKTLQDAAKNMNVQTGLASFDVEGIINTLSTPIMPDEGIAETFRQTAESLCKGELDLDGAVAKIEQDVRNYLAERT